MKIKIIFSIFLADSLLDSDLACEIIYNINQISIFDLSSYLNNIGFFSYSASDINHYNIPHYSFNIVDISKLSHVHKEIAINYSLNRGNFSLVYSPYQTLIYSLLKPIYFVPFTGIILITFQNLNRSLVFLIDGIYKNLSKQLTRCKKISLNLIKEILSKNTVNKKLMPRLSDLMGKHIPSYLRNVTAYAVNNIKINRNTTITDSSSLANLMGHFDRIYREIRILIDQQTSSLPC